MITILLLVRAIYTYIWVLFFAHIPFVVNSIFNATPTERFATTSPPFHNEPHRSHVLFVKVATATTFTSDHSIILL